MKREDTLSVILIILIFSIILISPNIQSSITGQAIIGSVIYTVERDNVDLQKAGLEGMTSSEETIYIHAAGSNRFIIPANSMDWKNGDLNNNHIKTSKIWLKQLETNKIRVFYQDINHVPDIMYLGYLQLPSNVFFLKFSENTDVGLRFTSEISNNKVELTIDTTHNDFVKTFWNINPIYLGSSSKIAEENELIWSNIINTENIGTKTQDYVTPYGLTIKTPSSYGMSDSIVFQVPIITCGDGICDANAKEDCTSCPQDCKTASDEICCIGELFKGNCCSDTDCNINEKCFLHICKSSVTTCGNNICDPGEDVNNCPLDCGKPDLIVEEIGFSPVPQPNQNFQIIAKIKNIGTKDLKVNGVIHSWFIKFKIIGTNNEYTVGRLNIDPGKSVIEKSKEFKLPSGNYELKVQADMVDEFGKQSNGYISELNENNNEKTKSFEINELICSDGTHYGSCSSMQPLFCENGNLINKCSKCGCPVNQKCEITEKCISMSETCSSLNGFICSPAEICPGSWISASDTNRCCSITCKPPENEKNLNKYTNKEVFLISDENWKDILSLTPMNVWTDKQNNIYKYPTLIYHREGDNFDADSIIYFMQQYLPNKVTIIGETPQELDNLISSYPENTVGAGLRSDQIKRITLNDYFSYWSSFIDIVYVEDNYKLALLASTYASLINAPLVIKNTALDSENIFKERRVICIGSVSPIGSQCFEQYNLEQLQQKYFEKTNTNKVILVNPDDLNIKRIASYIPFIPDKSSELTTIYTKDSLAAPILASAKHELIIPIQSTDYNVIDQKFTSELNKYFDVANENKPFLTIIASPDAIPAYKSYSCIYANRIEVDGRIYGSLNNYGLIDLPVGRIMGLTISDVSGYIARDLFFNDLSKNKEALIVIPEGHQPEITQICQELGITENCNTNEQALEEFARRYFWTNEIKNQFSQEYFYSGHSEAAANRQEIFGRYNQVYLNLFGDHGSTTGFSGMMNTLYMTNNKLYLKPSFTLDFACRTCYYEGYPDLFCVQGIRRGTLAQQGAVDSSYWHHEFDDILNKVMLEGKTIGEAYMEARNEEYNIENIDNLCPPLRGDPFYVLLGDPTWRPKWW